MPTNDAEVTNMDKAMLSLLSEPERLLVQQTEPAVLRTLDEDEAGELLLRVRRARNKYTTNYRRQAAARVATKRSRAAATGSGNKTAMKAEIFEGALARVSSHLARLAKASATALRAERIAAAKAVRSAAPPAARPRAASGSSSRTGAPRVRRTVETKQVASTRAAGARRQARRDSR